MNKIVLPLLLSVLFWTVASSTTEAQSGKPAVKPKPKPAAAAVGGFVIKSSWGGYQGVQNNLITEQARELLKVPLQFTNNKGVELQLSSYRFAYTKVGVTEDEETGKVSPVTTLSSDRFTATPLPDTWRNIIYESLQKGESLYFYDIIVIDNQGRRSFAPDIKVIAK